MVLKYSTPCAELVRLEASAALSCKIFCFCLEIVEYWLLPGWRHRRGAFGPGPSFASVFLRFNVGAYDSGCVRNFKTAIDDSAVRYRNEFSNTGFPKGPERLTPEEIDLYWQAILEDEDQLRFYDAILEDGEWLDASVNQTGGSATAPEDKRYVIRITPKLKK